MHITPLGQILCHFCICLPVDVIKEKPEKVDTTEHEIGVSYTDSGDELARWVQKKPPRGGLEWIKLRRFAYLRGRVVLKLGLPWSVPVTSPCLFNAAARAASSACCTAPSIVVRLPWPSSRPLML